MICLFGGLVKYARLHLEDGTLENVASRLGVDVETVQDYENNVQNPTADVLQKFSDAYEIDKELLDFYVFHEDEPKRLSKKLAKKCCVFISICLHKYIA